MFEAFFKYRKQVPKRGNTKSEGDVLNKIVSSNK
jgi:hypothetical protein